MNNERYGKLSLLVACFRKWQ